MSEQRGKGRGRGKKVVQQPPGPPRPTSVEPSTSSVTGTVPRTFADASGAGAQRTRDVVADLGRGFDRMKVQSERSEDLPANRGGVRGRKTLPTEPLILREVSLTTKKGTSGERCVVTSNYFKLLTTTDWCLYQYHVDFAPEEDRTSVRKALMKPHKERFGAYTFDGTSLYTSRRLPEMELFSTRSSDDTHIRLQIRLVGELNKGHYQYLQFFNLIVRKCLEALQLVLIGRNYYNKKNIIDIREFSLELWPGYLTSIRQHERDILMCAEVIHKVMRKQTLLHILRDCLTEDRRHFKNLYSNMVVGTVVLTRYNNTTYRIEDVDFDASPKTTFMKNGEKVTYVDYYQKRYGERITDLTQPLLVTRGKTRSRQAEPAELVHLIPELCLATGLTEDMKNNVQLMRGLAVHTRINPEGRIQKLLEFNKILTRNKDISKELSDWNLKLDENLFEFPARHLKHERLLFGGNTWVNLTDSADWSREMQNKQCLNTIKLNNWVIIGGDRDRDAIQGFLGKLHKVSSAMSFMIDRPREYYIQSDSASTYAHKLEEILSQNLPQLVFCVVSNNRADRYTAIKKKCCVDRPVPSQVYLKKNLFHKNLLSIATKVAIQINCKLGGSPWCVDLPIDGLMVIGFDVCHDPTAKGKDFGAMVASLDRTYSRYYSAVNLHDKTQELSNEFGANISKALQAYRNHNRALPLRIVIYRDGVGEGQVPYVLEHEVEDIKKRLNQMYGGDTYQMAFIIVNKRINTRFFTNTGKNALPGTVVDDFVTSPTKFDFFIVSQQVRQGTITPTSYSVIFENCKLDADKLQRLTYKLTHMYFNTSCTVRVPAPCHYAHKLAFLVAKFIHHQPHSQLENTLYFL